MKETPWEWEIASKKGYIHLIELIGVVVVRSVVEFLAKR